MMKNSLGTTLAVEKYGSSFFKNGAQPSGVLEHPGVLKDPAKIRENWSAVYGGASNAHKVAVLEEGIARLDEKQRAVVCDFNIDEDGIVLPTKNKFYSEKQLKGMRAVLRGAVLYILAYLYEHREEADYHDLTITLRAILSPIRGGASF